VKRLALILPLLCFGSANSNDDPIVQLFSQVANVSIPRNPTYKVYNPFIKPKPPITISTEDEPPQEVPDLPKLGAIVNDRVFLNKRWAKKGDEVGGYRVLIIGKNGVILKREDKLYKISFLSSTNRLRIQITKR